MARDDQDRPQTPTSGGANAAGAGSGDGGARASGEATTTTQTPQGADGDAAPPEIAFCRGCDYDLTATVSHVLEKGEPDEPARCPECGREFVAADTTTFVTSRKRELGKFTLTTALPIGVTVALIVFGLLETWIPLPGPLEQRLGVTDWRCWVWMDKLYGWEERGGGIEMFHWGGQTPHLRRWMPASGISAGGAQRTLLWEVERTSGGAASGADSWKVTVREQGVPWPEILAGWNQTRDRIFGFRTIDGPHTAPGPYTIEGTEEDVLTELARLYDLELQAHFPTGRSLTDTVWIWHPQHDRVTEVTRAEADELIGYDPFDRSDPDHPEYRRLRLITGGAEEGRSDPGPGDAETNADVKAGADAGSTADAEGSAAPDR